MRKICFLLVSACLFCVVCLIAEAQQKEELPPGMEIIEIGDVKHLVPIGTKVRKESGVVILEGHNEYMARRFIGVEQRLEKIESELEEIRKTIEEIKKEPPN